MRPSRGRILVVDDEPLVLEIFTAVLKEEGFAVDEAASAMEALLKLEAHPFDLLVCDLRLHPFDGFEIAEIARKRQSEIGVLLTTGAPHPTDLERAEKVEAKYLRKPVSLDELRRGVLELYQHVRKQNPDLVSLGCALGLAFPGWGLKLH